MQMLIAVLILSVVVLIEGYVIVEKEGRIIYLRKRLLRQIRITDSLKNNARFKKLIVHPAWGESDEQVMEQFKDFPLPIEISRMPIEMTEVKNDV